MDNREEALRLLSIAHKDLTAASAMEAPQFFAEEIFGFHVQQVIEKTLKAWLASLGVEYPWTHDIRLLLSRLAEHGIPIENYNDLMEFTPFAVQFRYEAFDDFGEPLDRPAVIQRISELVEQVQQLIEGLGERDEQSDMISRSVAETLEFGQRLGALLQPGDMVALTGDLGAGKTCCIQGIALGLGVPAATAVTSPTYTLIHEYQGRIPLYHFDVYRLNQAEDLCDLGYEEYFYGAGVCVIEWADRIASFLPDEHLALHLSIQPDLSRRIELEGHGDRYQHVIRIICA